MIKLIRGILFIVFTIYCFGYCAYYLFEYNLWTTALSPSNFQSILYLQFLMVIYTLISVLLIRNMLPLKIVIIFPFLVLLLSNTYSKIPSYVYEYSLGEMLLSCLGVIIIQFIAFLLWFSLGLVICGSITIFLSDVLPN